MSGKRKSLELESILLDDYICRESHVKVGLVNRRRFVLSSYYGNRPSYRLASYHHRQDEHPSKTWNINSQCTISPVESKTYKLRGSHTPVIVAFASGSIKMVLLYSFKLTFDTPGGFWRGDPNEHIVLCFEDLESASNWHERISKLIIEESAFDRPTVVSMTAQSTEENFTVPHSSNSPPQTNGTTDHRHHTIKRPWHSVRHMNGIAVYAEEQSEEGVPAFMVSTTVRESPEKVFRAILDGNYETLLPLLGQGTLLSDMDAHTQISQHEFRLEGILGLLCSPRELTIVRTWLQDEDGTYIVLYQSRPISSPKRQRDWYSFRRNPICADLQAAGFTIAPLLPEYRGGGSLQECLLTLVFKIDMGGAIGSTGVVTRLAAPLAAAIQWAVVEPILRSLVMLRDKIEQSRFTIRPSSELATAHFDDEVKEEEVADGDMAMAWEADVEPIVEEAAIPPEVPVDVWGTLGSCPPQYWAPITAHGLRIRGPHYLVDKKKVEASAPLLHLSAADLVNVEEPLWHISRYLPSVQHATAPFQLVLNIMYPAGSYSPMQCIVATWKAPLDIETTNVDELVAACCPDGDHDGSGAAGFTLLQDWIKGSGKEADARRNKLLKMIPRVAGGPWLVRKAVGTTPVLLGQKLTTKYHKGKTLNGGKYLEIDIDISSDTVARSVTGLVVGAITSLVIDWSVLLEGQSVDVLPERLLGMVRFSHLALNAAATFDEETGKLIPP